MLRISKRFLALVPRAACKHSHEIPPWFSDGDVVKSNLGLVRKWEVEKKSHTCSAKKDQKRMSDPLITGSHEPPCGQ